MRTQSLMQALLALGCAITAAGAAAQETYPNQPIKIVVPFTAGGVVDVIARTIGEKLSAQLGQPVIVDNRAGAGGSLGTELVARAKPDGYTLLAVTFGHAVLPSIMKSNWETVRDFRGIAGFGVVPNVIVVHPSVPANTMAEFVALAKKSSDPMTYATPGIGSSNHLSGELLAQMANIKLSHVPYKGQPDAVSDLLGGRVSMMPLTAALAAPYIKAGKLRALAVTTPKRSRALPTLPTVAEAVPLPGYEVTTWFGLVAPAKTPDAIVTRLSTAVMEILAMPDVAHSLQGIGLELAPQKPQEFDQLVAGERAKWARVIATAGIKPE